MGVTGTSITAGFLTDLDQNAEVRGDLWYGTPVTIGLASKMMRDPHVRQALNSVKDPIMGADWDIEPAGKTPLDKEIADYIRWNLFEKSPWTSTLEKILYYLRDGFSFLEATDDVTSISKSRFPLHPGGSRGLTITGLHHRPAWTVHRFFQDSLDPSKLAEIEQFSPANDVESAGFYRVSADRLLRFTWEQEGAQFTGFPPLRSAYGPWKAKLLLMVVEMIGHERAHVPIPQLTLPDGQEASKDDIAEAQRILAQIRAHEKAYILLPDGMQFTWARSDGGTDIHQTIERLIRDIAFAFNNQHMLLGSQGGTGSYALSGIQQNTQQIALEKHANFIAQILTSGCDGWSVIERLVRANYGSEPALPRVVVRNMPTRNWEKYITSIPQLIQAGALTPDKPLEDYLRVVLRLTPREESESEPEIKAESKDEQTVPEPVSEPTEPMASESADPVIPEAVEVDLAVAEVKQAERLLVGHMAQAQVVIDKFIAGQWTKEACTNFLSRSLLLDPLEIEKWFAGLEVKESSTPIPVPVEEDEISGEDEENDEDQEA